MSQELTLRAEPRTVHGKKVKRLRREGLIPAVVYGPVVNETISVSVNRREFDRFFNQTGHSTIFTLEWDGGSQPVLIREVQLDPVTRASLHVDFFAPNMRVVLRQSVSVIFHNLNPNANGILETLLNEVEVEALPSSLPHQLDADISELIEVGSSLHVRDLIAPEGVTIITDPDEVIAVIAQTAAQAEDAAEAAEAAEAVTDEAAAEEAAVPGEA
jgi:large subunit ribosomal protein L25